MIRLVQHLTKLLLRILKILKRLRLKQVAMNVNSTNFEKRCLLLYLATPFFKPHGVYAGNPFHQNRIRVLLLARELAKRGFNVDAVNLDYPKAKLGKSYDLLIDLHPGYNPLGNACARRDTRRVFYATGSAPAFQSAAETARLRALAKRRNVVLARRRHHFPIAGDLLRSYDAMWFIGNQYNLDTYGRSVCENVCFLSTTAYEFPPMVEVDDHKATKNFLFLAGPGQVFKGLDLLLEVFARNRDLTLYVCSKFKWELDFCWCYRKELFDTPNIVPVGFINILADRRFTELRRKCGFMVLPSCAEANAGSVLTAMSAGLVPIVSKECGFEADEVNYFDNCSIETIERTVRSYAMQDPDWLHEQRIKTVHTVRTRYSSEAHVRSLRAAMEQLLNSSG